MPRGHDDLIANLKPRSDPCRLGVGRLHFDFDRNEAFITFHKTEIDTLSFRKRLNGNLNGIFFIHGLHTHGGIHSGTQTGLWVEYPHRNAKAFDATTRPAFRFGIIVDLLDNPLQRFVRLHGINFDTDRLPFLDRLDLRLVDLGKNLHLRLVRQLDQSLPLTNLCTFFHHPFRVAAGREDVREDHFTFFARTNLDDAFRDLILNFIKLCLLGLQDFPLVLQFSGQCGNIRIEFNFLTLLGLILQHFQLDPSQFQFVSRAFYRKLCGLKFKVSDITLRSQSLAESGDFFRLPVLFLREENLVFRLAFILFEQSEQIFLLGDFGRLEITEGGLHSFLCITNGDYLLLLGLFKH